GRPNWAGKRPPAAASLLGPRSERGKLMKRLAVYALVLCISLLGFSSDVSSSPAHRSRLVVDDDKLECPNAQFSSIQAAVDAASPGDEIHVCKGLYAEQVNIRKPLEINADNGATLKPSAMQANAASLFDAAPIATALLVADTTGVSISGLTVDGANNGISG